MCIRTAHPRRLFLLLAFASLVLSSCGGQPPPEDPSLAGPQDPEAASNDNRLTIALLGRDSPGVVSLVVSLTSVEVHREADDPALPGEWVLLTDVPQEIDVLTLTGGLEALLVDSSLNLGTYDKIRLKFGGAWITVLDATYEMDLIAGRTIEHPLEYLEMDRKTRTILQLDFDPLQSVRLLEDGTFLLQPALSVVEWSQVGSLSGTVFPPGIGTEVSAYRMDNRKLIATAVADAEGAYSIPRLRAATDDGVPILYALSATAEGYSGQIYTDVAVVPGVDSTGYDFWLVPPSDDETTTDSFRLR
jgi:hypothetical protein